MSKYRLTLSKEQAHGAGGFGVDLWQWIGNKHEVLTQAEKRLLGELQPCRPSCTLRKEAQMAAKEAQIRDLAEVAVQLRAQICDLRASGLTKEQMNCLEALEARVECLEKQREGMSASLKQAREEKRKLAAELEDERTRRETLEAQHDTYMNANLKPGDEVYSRVTGEGPWIVTSLPWIERNSEHVTLQTAADEGKTLPTVTLSSSPPVKWWRKRAVWAPLVLLAAAICSSAVLVQGVVMLFTLFSTPEVPEVPQQRLDFYCNECAGEALMYPQVTGTLEVTGE